VDTDVTLGDEIAGGFGTPFHAGAIFRRTSTRRPSSSRSSKASRPSPCLALVIRRECCSERQHEISLAFCGWREGCGSIGVREARGRELRHGACGSLSSGRNGGRFADARTILVVRRCGAAADESRTSPVSKRMRRPDGEIVGCWRLLLAFGNRRPGRGGGHRVPEVGAKRVATSTFKVILATRIRRIGRRLRDIGVRSRRTSCVLQSLPHVRNPRLARRRTSRTHPPTRKAWCPLALERGRSPNCVSR